VTTRERFTGYSEQSYRKSHQTSVTRTRVETPTIVSSGCGTTCPHTTVDSPAGSYLSSMVALSGALAE
jgi:hypothetical protein